MDKYKATATYYTKKALPEDERLVRKLLRESPMRGAVNVSLQQEPDATIAARIKGFQHDTVFVVNKTDNELLGMGSRSVRCMYINGQVKAIGYLSELRASFGRKGLKRLISGFNAIKESRDSNDLTFDITTIIDDNSEAKRLLEKGLNGMPKYKKYAELTTFLIPVKKINKEHLPQPRIASPKDIPNIAKCLQKYLSQYQFAPYWDQQALESKDLCIDLNHDDFLVIYDGQNITSCAAIWDQRKFKQVVIHSYSKVMLMARPLLNLYFYLMSKPTLPKPLSTLNIAYLSHLAVKDNNPDIFKSIMRRARIMADQKGVDYLVIGLATSHPLYSTLKKSSCYQYNSNLYTVHWNEQLNSTEPTGTPYIEVAIL